MWWITLIIVIILTDSCIPRGNLTQLWGIFNAHIWFGNTMLCFELFAPLEVKWGHCFLVLPISYFRIKLLYFLHMSWASLLLISFLYLCNILLTIPWDFSRLSWKTTGLSRGYWGEEICDSHFCLFNN